MHNEFYTVEEITRRFNKIKNKPIPLATRILKFDRLIVPDEYAHIADILNKKAVSLVYYPQSKLFVVGEFGKVLETFTEDRLADAVEFLNACK